jgi:hypothetical protein
MRIYASKSKVGKSSPSSYGSYEVGQARISDIFHGPCAIRPGIQDMKVHLLAPPLRNVSAETELASAYFVIIARQFQLQGCPGYGYAVHYLASITEKNN